MQDRWNAPWRLVAGVTLVAAAGLASGCMSSPTYGTDKTANAQLMSDLSGIASFRDKKKPTIDYTPRPDLVKTAKRGETLPPPQDNVTTANANWPESPEQRLARVRAEADANSDNPNYQSTVVPDVALAQQDNFKKPGQSWRSFEAGNDDPRTMTTSDSAKRAEYKKRLQETQQGDPTKRKYLSEPPTEYRQAYADAPQGELGEDEYRKERRLKRAATKNRTWWDDINPF
jgi:hypothetical protein